MYIIIGFIIYIPFIVIDMVVELFDTVKDLFDLKLPIWIY